MDDARATLVEVFLAGEDGQPRNARLLFTQSDGEWRLTAMRGVIEKYAQTTASVAPGVLVPPRAP